MAGRPQLPIGRAGSIATWKTGKLHTAKCRYRDADGVTRAVTARGKTAQAARNALQDKLDMRCVGMGTDITGESLVSELAETWFLTVDQSQATKDSYRDCLDRHILPAVGATRLREATTARLEAFLRALRAPSAAKRARVVLSLMFNLAARYDAVAANPVTETRLPASAKKSVTALDIEDVMQVRADVERWAGTTQSRMWMVDAADLFIATGLRTGELLAVRVADVDLKGKTLTVTGTIKRDSVNGLHRQAYPKSAAGERTLVLPDFAVAMLRRRRLAGASDLLFANRKGGPMEPANFRRLWREFRGEKWAHVEPRSFRKAVATLIERESGSLVASKQLGHSSDAVTIKHYIERNHAAPDSTAALNKFRRAE